MAKLTKEELLTLDTHARIIECAIQEFAKYGYNGTSTAKISAKASISEAMLFKLFKSKKELLHQVLLEIVTVRIPKLAGYGLEGFLNASGDQQTAALMSLNETQLRQLMKKKIEYILDNIEIMKVFLIELHYHDDVKYIYTQQFVPMMIEKFGGVLDRLKAAGYVRPSLETRLVVRTLIGAFAAMILDKTLMSKEMDVDHEIDKIMELIFYGIVHKEAESCIQV